MKLFIYNNQPWLKLEQGFDCTINFKIHNFKIKYETDFFCMAEVLIEWKMLRLGFISICFITCEYKEN